MLDVGHFPRPATRLLAELFPAPVARGFRRATQRYGLLLDHIEWSFVHGWAYLCPRPVAPLRGWEQRSPANWAVLVGSSAALRRRLAVSAAVFERRPWRRDLARWDDRVQPALAEANRRLGRIDVDRLDDGQLLDHLDRCREHLRRALWVHHRLNVTPAVPVGDLVVHVRAWTGRPAGDVLRLLRAAGARPTGVAGELDGVAEVLADDPAASTHLWHETDEVRTLSALRALPGPAGRAVDRYVDTVGWWSAGTSGDLADPCLMEMPAVLVGSLRAAVRAAARPAPDDAADDEADLRRSVPAGRRRAFGELLAEARAVHRLRDERALSCDVWARGVLRRAVVAAGDRLCRRGVLEHPSHLLEARHAELHVLLRGGARPAGDELAERARARAQASADGVPEVLGGPPPAPVPPAWLDAGPARTERAFRTYVEAMSEDDGDARAERVGGVAASPGVHEGTARLVRDAADFARVRPGDVVVSSSTSPAFNPVLALAGAIVTDQGGLMSHAAIVARDLRIPAVVGTGDATRRLSDGARVRVDGHGGEVTVLA